MHPFLQLLFWLVITASVPPALMILTSSRWSWWDVWQIYWLSAMFGTLIGLPASFILPRLMGRCAGLHSGKRMAVFATTLFGLASMGTTLGVFLLMAVGYIPRSQFGHWMARSYSWAMFLSVCIGVITYAYGHLRHQIEATNDKLRARERLASETRIASLEARIHPHFLFNALNAVSSLIRDDPARAEVLLERVSALLRFSLYESQAGLVTLERELAMTRDYLEIESVRFGPRLRYSIECAPGLNAVMVPPLAIQTLVENSVKYGVTNRREGGEVRVIARTGLVEAEIEVWDSGSGFNPEAIPAGHGLELLSSRLEAHFGSQARVDYLRGEGSMTVRLRLPLGVPA